VVPIRDKKYESPAAGAAGPLDPHISIVAGFGEILGQERQDLAYCRSVFHQHSVENWVRL